LGQESSFFLLTVCFCRIVGMMAMNLEAPELKWIVKFCELPFSVRGRNGNRGAFWRHHWREAPDRIAFGEAGTPSF
jgi:hypothetical protein